MPVEALPPATPFTSQVSGPLAVAEKCVVCPGESATYCGLRVIAPLLPPVGGGPPGGGVTGFCGGVGVGPNETPHPVASRASSNPALARTTTMRGGFTASDGGPWMGFHFLGRYGTAGRLRTGTRHDASPRKRGLARCRCSEANAEADRNQAFGARPLKAVRRARRLENRPRRIALRRRTSRCCPDRRSCGRCRRRYSRRPGCWRSEQPSPGC